MPEERRIPTPAPADLPTFKIMVDGAQISPTYQVVSVVVTRQVNRVAAADIFIHDGDPAKEDFEVSNADDFVPGSEIEIHAGYHSDEELIFRGVVVRHGIRVYQEQGSHLRVECRDAAVALTVGRKSAYFYDSTDSDIIDEVAGAAGLATDVASTSVQHGQMVQYDALDWDFVIARAEANGLLVFTEDGTLRVAAPEPDGDAVLSLRFGGNILSFEAAMDARDQYAAVEAAAWTAADQELTAVEGEDPGIGTPGNVEPDTLAGVIGLDTFGLRHGGHRADDELQAWADAQALKSRLAMVRGRVRIQGHAGVAPGAVVELSGVGERFNGKAFVSGVRHEITVENWETDITFGLAPEWFVAEAGRVAGPRAGGLVPPVPGLQIGRVTRLAEDPDGEHRIQVRTPMIDPSAEGIWARVSTLDAGDTRGTFFLPEIGDEVVLGFAHDDPRDAIVLGMLHSSAKPAPLAASDDNHEKGLFTRSGMKVLFDDDKISVTIETPNGNKIVLSDDDGGITLEDENQNKIVMDSAGITIESAADVIIKASGDVKVEGTNVSSAANAQFKAEGSAGAEMSSGATTVVKGSLVQIN